MRNHLGRLCRAGAGQPVSWSCVAGSLRLRAREQVTGAGIQAGLSTDRKKSREESTEVIKEKALAGKVAIGTT